MVFFIYYLHQTTSVFTFQQLPTRFEQFAACFFQQNYTPFTW